MSPLDEQKGFCLDIASCMLDEFIFQSLTKDEEIELSCQIARSPTYIAQRIDAHSVSKTPRKFSKARLFL